MTYCYEYPRASNTVDAIIIDKQSKSKVLLIKRGNDPFKGYWALPGGYIEMSETLEESIKREILEETNIVNQTFYQYKTFGNPHRDPRGRTITTIFYCFYANDEDHHAGDDAADIKWFDIKDIALLAFDHAEILKEFCKDILNEDCFLNQK